MPGLQDIAILGSGRVGSALGKLWTDAGESVVVMASRRAARAEAAARFAGVHRHLRDFPRAAAMGRWVVLAVVDDALPTVVQRLAASRVDWKGKTVLHTSGYHGADALAVLTRRGANVGTLHPLMAIASPVVWVGTK
jgi:predicted dinucleotide-binding enzyme